MSELFRREAIDHQRQRFHGAIVLTRSPWRAVWTAGFVLLVLALFWFAATQGFTRKELVSGVMLPAGGVLRLVAPQAGVLLAGEVSQGQRVAAGQVVFRLSSERLTAQGATLERIGQSLRSRQSGLQGELAQHDRQATLQASTLAARTAHLVAGLTQQEREIALQRERVALLQAVAARYPDLVTSGAVSAVEAAEKSAEALDQQARLATLEREYQALQMDLASTRAQQAALPLQAGREGSQLQREMQALSQQQVENEARREVAVLAPQPGQLATLLVQPGQAVAAGQVVATLLPEGAVLEAALAVPTGAAGFVRPGTPVWLRVDAFPYARFGQLPGHVTEVSSSAESLVEAAAGPHSYRVRVRLDPPPVPDALSWRQALKAGMQVQASLMAEKRSLLEWALEPLATLRVAAR